MVCFWVYDLWCVYVPELNLLSFAPQRRLKLSLSPNDFEIAFLSYVQQHSQTHNTHSLPSSLPLSPPSWNIRRGGGRKQERHPSKDNENRPPLPPSLPPSLPPDSARADTITESHGARQ